MVGITHAELVEDLFRAATRGETHARCLLAELHGTGCILNAGHEPNPCLVMPLDPVSPETFWKLAHEGEDE